MPFAMTARFVPLAITILLAACSSAPDRAPTRPRSPPPVTLTAPPSRATQACFADLARENVRHSPLLDRDYGGGCIVSGAVQLLDYRRTRPAT